MKENEEKIRELDNIADALPPITLELLVTFARGMWAGIRENGSIGQYGLSAGGYPAQTVQARAEQQRSGGAV
jgi:hypothetical protein